MNKKTFLIWSTLVIALSSAVALAQEEKVVSETNLVTVNVIVTIAHFSTDEAGVSIGIVCEIHNTTPEKTRAILNSVRQRSR
jgi:hypothetical protein